jgi:hypothetical protein
MIIGPKQRISQPVQSVKSFGVIIDCVFVSVVFYALHSLVIAALWIWYRVSQLWVHFSTPHYWVLYGSVPGVELWMRRVLSPLATVSPLGEIACAFPLSVSSLAVMVGCWLHVHTPAV